MSFLSYIQPRTTTKNASFSGPISYQLLVLSSVVYHLLGMFKISIQGLGFNLVIVHLPICITFWIWSRLIIPVEVHLSMNIWTVQLGLDRWGNEDDKEWGMKLRVYLEGVSWEGRRLFKVQNSQDLTKNLNTTEHWKKKTNPTQRSPKRDSQWYNIPTHTKWLKVTK